MCVDAPENSAIAMQRSVAAQKMELEPSRSTGSESMDHEDPPFRVVYSRSAYAGA